MSTPPNAAAPTLIERFEASRRPFRALAQHRADAGELDRPTAAGWTAKEMLGHVAFWEECVEPVLRGLFRHELELEGWTFPSGYVTGAEWPDEDEHNAREAAWAKAEDAETVLARWDAAHQSALAVLATVTGAEAAENARYFEELASHLDEHHAELRASGPTALR